MIINIVKSHLDEDMVDLCFYKVKTTGHDWCSVPGYLWVTPLEDLAELRSENRIHLGRSEWYQPQILYIMNEIVAKQTCCPTPELNPERMRGEPLQYSTSTYPVTVSIDTNRTTVQE